MISDDNFFRLSAQVQGLEMVVKTAVALLYASGVKNEAGFAKAAEQVRSVGQHLQEHIDTVMKAAPDNPVRDVMEPALRDTVRRCLEGAEAQLREVAALVLAVSDPASDAKN